LNALFKSKTFAARTALQHNVDPNATMKIMVKNPSVSENIFSEFKLTTDPLNPSLKNYSEDDFIVSLTQAGEKYDVN
jgi:hypothetical protein